MDNNSDALLKKILSEPLRIEENDPEREAIEQHIVSLSENQITRLYTRTRKAAGQSKRQKDLDNLFLYVRACKTIQRIANDKDIILSTDI